jgi:hypothetical protein
VRHHMCMAQVIIDERAFPEVWKGLFRYVMITGPYACVRPAWRSVGFRSGHTVGGMYMQPAGVAIRSVSMSPTAMQVCRGH